MLDLGFWYRARAPLRLSFGGGGTEISPYCDEHGGAVLNATIQRYVYAMLRARREGVLFEAADLGICEQLPTASCYPIDAEAKLPLHRAVYNYMVREYCGGEPQSLHLKTYSEVPVGSGLGASSTLTVAAVRCMDEALGLTRGEYELAALSHTIERSELGLSGGLQDHYAAAFGGFNFIEFRSDGTVIVNPLRVRTWIQGELEASLMLYFTGISRESSRIIDTQQHNLAQDDRVVVAMHRIKAVAYAMKDQLLTGNIGSFAASLHEGWIAKRSTAREVSNANIDALYDRACAAGALGGKISGAGGGGFLMLLVDPAQRAAVFDELSSERQQPISCHFSSDGASAWRIAI